MIAEIQRVAVARGITRLCHLTPSKNLVHIATDPMGILASHRLAADNEATFNPIDHQRLDGFQDHICCSIEYPNAWFLRKVRTQDHLFDDWVILLVKAHYLWKVGTKFSPRNAAAEYGNLVSSGSDSFERLFAEETLGAQGQKFRRGATHPAFLPTDEQAEVLIPEAIPLFDLLGVVVQTSSQAKREIARMETLGVHLPKFLIVPDMFNPTRLSHILRSGSRPPEVEHHDE